MYFQSAIVYVYKKKAWRRNKWLTPKVKTGESDC